MTSHTSAADLHSRADVLDHNDHPGFRRAGLTARASLADFVDDEGLPFRPSSDAKYIKG